MIGPASNLSRRPLRVVPSPSMLLFGSIWHTIKNVCLRRSNFLSSNPQFWPRQDKNSLLAHCSSRCTCSMLKINQNDYHYYFMYQQCRVQIGNTFDKTRSWSMLLTASCTKSKLNLHHNAHSWWSGLSAPSSEDVLFTTDPMNVGWLRSSSDNLLLGLGKLHNST